MVNFFNATLLTIADCEMASTIIILFTAACSAWRDRVKAADVGDHSKPAILVECQASAQQS